MRSVRIGSWTGPPRGIGAPRVGITLRLAGTGPSTTLKLAFWVCGTDLSTYVECGTDLSTCVVCGTNLSTDVVCGTNLSTLQKPAFPRRNLKQLLRNDSYLWSLSLNSARWNSNWTGLAPCQFEFPFPGSLASTCLAHRLYVRLVQPRQIPETAWLYKRCGLAGAGVPAAELEPAAPQDRAPPHRWQPSQTHQHLNSQLLKHTLYNKP